MITNFADTVARLRSLSAACRKYPQLMALIHAELGELEEAVASATAAKTCQESLEAERQQTTLKIRALLAQAADLERRLHSAARMCFGPRDERLLEFRIKPLAPRGAQPPRGWQ